MRLPSRTVPICVSEPIGLARPRRMAYTPAIVVVLTAPIPTSRMPSFPVASAIFGGFFTTGDYIIRADEPRGWRAREACVQSSEADSLPNAMTSQIRARAARGLDVRAEARRSFARDRTLRYRPRRRRSPRKVGTHRARLPARRVGRRRRRPRRLRSSSMGARRELHGPVHVAAIRSRRVRRRRAAQRARRHRAVARAPRR